MIDDILAINNHKNPQTELIILLLSVLQSAEGRTAQPVIYTLLTAEPHGAIRDWRLGRAWVARELSHKEPDGRGAMAED